jgi:hypothetical protein
MVIKRNIIIADTIGHAVEGSLAGIAGSNPAGGMNVCLSRVLYCQVEVSASGLSPVQRRTTECGGSN